MRKLVLKRAKWTCPRITGNIALERIRTQVAILGSLLFYCIISRPTWVWGDWLLFGSDGPHQYCCESDVQLDSSGPLSLPSPSPCSSKSRRSHFHSPAGGLPALTSPFLLRIMQRITVARNSVLSYVYICSSHLSKNFPDYYSILSSQQHFVGQKGGCHHSPSYDQGEEAWRRKPPTGATRHVGRCWSQDLPDWLLGPCSRKEDTTRSDPAQPSISWEDYMSKKGGMHPQEEEEQSKSGRIW